MSSLRNVAPPLKEIQEQQVDAIRQGILQLVQQLLDMLVTVLVGRRHHFQ
jgi:hypothetical protein